MWRIRKSLGKSSDARRGMNSAMEKDVGRTRRFRELCWIGHGCTACMRRKSGEQSWSRWGPRRFNKISWQVRAGAHERSYMCETWGRVDHESGQTSCCGLFYFSSEVNFIAQENKAPLLNCVLDEIFSYSVRQAASLEFGMFCAGLLISMIDGYSSRNEKSGYFHFVKQLHRSGWVQLALKKSTIFHFIFSASTMLAVFATTVSEKKTLHPAKSACISCKEQGICISTSDFSSFSLVENQALNQVCASWF